MSPLQRSLKLLRDRGYTVAIVEHWNPFAKVRQDLFGFIDLLCIKKGEVVGVQVTHLKGWHPHVAKIKEGKHYKAVTSSGITIMLHGWRRLKYGWQVKEEKI